MKEMKTIYNKTQTNKTTIKNMELDGTKYFIKISKVYRWKKNDGTDEKE